MSDMKQLFGASEWEFINPRVHGLILQQKESLKPPTDKTESEDNTKILRPEQGNLFRKG